MKKIILVLGAACLVQVGYAQQSKNNDLPDRLFKQGKEMYLDNNYVGSLNSLSEFKRLSEDDKLKLEADYLIVCSEYFMGKSNAEVILKNYLDNNPETYHRNQICFYIGSTHFDKKEWAKALYWFAQSDVSYLNDKEQEDYTFRSGYSNLQQGNLADARQAMGLLSIRSKKYYEPADFYLAYIDFRNGEYDKSLKTIEKYKSKLEYKEEAQLFLLQGEFAKGDLKAAIADAHTYLDNYPNSSYLPEVHRILGNSYNRTSNVNKSLEYYEKYLEVEKQPLREDMYLLGTSYSQGKNYSKTIEVLQKVASTNDKLGQAAYMQLGQAYLATEDVANALLSFEAAAREKHDVSISEVALYNYAVLVNKTSLSVFDQSVTVLERFLNEYPKSGYAKHINTLLASTFVTTNNYSAALTAINNLKNPDNQILAAKQTVLFHLGTENFINSNYPSAIANLSASINMGNYDTNAKRQAMFWRGETYYRQDKYAQATADYNNYLSVAPSTDLNYCLALYNSAYAYFKQKQYDKALPNFQKYVNQEKNKTSDIYVDALNRLGDCYLHARDLNNSEKYYSQASSGKRGADYADFQKAFILGLENNSAAKITALDALVRKYPNSQYKNIALLEKAQTLVDLNKNTEAIKVLDGLIAGNPQADLMQSSGLLLGQLHYNNNNLAKALSAYKSVAEVNAKNDEGREAIHSLEAIYKDMNDISGYANYVNSLGSGVVITSGKQDSLTYFAAEGLLAKGQWSNAKAAFKKYLQSYPQGAYVGDAHFGLGSVAYQEDDATTEFNEFMLTVKDGNSRYMTDALGYVANIEMDRKNYQSAYDLYTQLNGLTSDVEVLQSAQLGIVRSAAALKKYNEVVLGTNTLLGGDKVSPEVAAEVRLLRAKAYLNTKQTDKAMTDLQLLGKDARIVYGAEAQSLIADEYYKAKSYDKAEKQVLAFVKQGTPHTYWMARALITLSDTYVARGDAFTAKQYLESIQSNYKNADADIKSMVSSRLATLNK